MAGYPAHSGSARDYDDRLTRLDVDHRLGTLPARYEQPLWLHFIEGMSQDEGEQALERSRSTVATQIERGLKRLRPTLSHWVNGNGKFPKFFGL
jgi:DNA-directed RNA polymerase specialized sigma24 family protein